MEATNDTHHNTAAGTAWLMDGQGEAAAGYRHPELAAPTIDVEMDTRYGTRIQPWTPAAVSLADHLEAGGFEVRTAISAAAGRRIRTVTTDKVAAAALRAAGIAYDDTDAYTAHAETLIQPWKDAQ